MKITCFRTQHDSIAFFKKTKVARLQLHVEHEWLSGKSLDLLITNTGPFGELFDLTKIFSLKSTVKIPRAVNARSKKATCVASGRTRGYNQFTGLSRFRMKEFMERGILPGMYRASW